MITDCSQELDISSFILGCLIGTKKGTSGGGGATYGLASVSIAPDIVTVTVTAEEVS